MLLTSNQSIQEFACPEIVYIKGCKNIVADILSRHPRIEALHGPEEILLADDNDDDAIKSIMEFANPINHDIHTVNPTGNCPYNQSIRRPPLHLDTKLVNHFIRLLL
jgi:hypothetical protein